MHHLNKHLVRVAYNFTYAATEFSDDYGHTWHINQVFPIYDINGEKSVDFKLVTALQIATLTGRDLVL